MLTKDISPILLKGNMLESKDARVEEGRSPDQGFVRICSWPVLCINCPCAISCERMSNFITPGSSSI